MREENLIHRSYSAYLNDENSPRSLFHNCFHSSEAIDWLIKQQLCKTIYDGLEIFQVLEKLKIIHHGKSFVGTKPKGKTRDIGEDEERKFPLFFCFHSLLIFVCVSGSTSA